MGCFLSLEALQLEKLICSFKNKVRSIKIQIYAAKKDENGGVIIGPRNFTTKPGKRGKNETVYFSRPPSYLCNGDLFKDPKSIGLRTEDKSLRGEVAFKPAKNVKDGDMTVSVSIVAKKFLQRSDYLNRFPLLQKCREMLYSP